MTLAVDGDGERKSFRQTLPFLNTIPVGMHAIRRESP